jgi:LuxR family transcriptional regulator, quorum-sensing system regulator SolR
MSNWHALCRDMRAIFNETDLFGEARRLSLSLGFDALVFALAIPAASLQRPLFRLYGLPPEPSSYGLYQAIRRATHGTLSGATWTTPRERESFPWLQALPTNLGHGWSQPTRSLGTEIGVASFARSCKFDKNEVDVLEPKMLLLSQTLHAQLMTVIIGRGDLYESLRAEELDVLRWAAQGKTATDIAQLMGLGERRVVYLTQLARSKMRASTTIQAAIRAQGYGLF